MPRVLIDTTTGRLYDKTQQAAAFQELPIYDELRSSMTTRLDHARIRKEVEMFYQYVMLSHKWQLHEPTFQTVENISIYGLPESPENNKVQRFCELVRSLQFHWAWSDTCCVNQQDKGVRQESVVAMFRWYRGSNVHASLSSTFSESCRTQKRLVVCGGASGTLAGGRTKNTLLPRLSNSTPRTGSHTLDWICSTTRNHLSSFQRWNRQ